MDQPDHTWPIEEREVPQGAMDEATSNPGGWVYEIDHSRIGDANGFVPGEAVVGGYEVGTDGVPTGRFARNPNFGPIRDDFSKLDTARTFPAWPQDGQGDAIREALTLMVTDQVEGTEIEWVKVTDKPELIVEGTRIPNSPDLLQPERAGIGVPVALGTRAPNGYHAILWGWFHWVIVGLEPGAQAMQRQWLDVRATRDHAKGALKRRLYEVDGESLDPER